MHHNFTRKIENPFSYLEKYETILYNRLSRIIGTVSHFSLQNRLQKGLQQS